MIQFEYVNVLVGLAMLIIGLFLAMFVSWIYGIAPATVGIVLIVCYRKYLLQLLGTPY